MAANSKDLELLINRALPVLYKEMRISYSDNTWVSVATKLSRRDEQWELWFNIEAPQAIAALGYLAPDIFNRMSGGANQASAITKGAYGQGFLEETRPFVVEETFRKKEEDCAAQLNNATSISNWWFIFYDYLPWALAKTRGWETPNEAQWAHAVELSTRFQALHSNNIEPHFLVRGIKTNDENVHAHAEWGKAASNFSNCLGRTFYPLLNHFFGMTLDSKAVHSINIKEFTIDALTSALCERAKPIVWAHCAIDESRSMPAYLLMQALKHESTAQVSTQLPEGLQLSSPGHF